MKPANQPRSILSRVVVARVPAINQMILRRRFPRNPSPLRPFSTSTLASSSSSSSRAVVPSIGDVVHSDARTTDFKTRVSAFHKQLVEARQKASALAHPGGRVGEQEKEKEKKQPGIVERFLYGSPEGQREEAEMEQSYSKVLARGKYVHAIELHRVKPDKVEKYVALVGETYPAIARDAENKCHLVGSWKTEIGDCETFDAGYHQTFSRLSTTASFTKFQSSLASLLRSRRTDLMQEFSFWPTASPRHLGGLFELRTYTLLPGHLLEWETHWRRGLAARKKVMEGVGAWFCQVGSLNTVHHLWQFADLRERQVGREQSWREKGWSDTVHRTVPLIKKMESRILVPLDWSPLS